MMMCNTIPATKANRLFWLGRYAERGYLNLHLLRRYYDRMIDDHTSAYQEFYLQLNAPNPYSDSESFKIGCLYDQSNPCSIVSGLELAYDNGIVLREEISTETLSYIHLSLAKIKDFASKGETNITHLQSITDYLLAFWGSIYERVFDERIRNFMKIGRLIENLDMHIRFSYPFYRIQEAFDSLRICADKEPNVFDATLFDKLEEMLSQEQYDAQSEEYRAMMLKFLNNLVLV